MEWWLLQAEGGGSRELSGYSVICDDENVLKMDCDDICNRVCVCVCVCVLVTQLCLTPCDPMDCGPPSSSVHGILQAGILE